MPHANCFRGLMSFPGRRRLPRCRGKELERKYNAFECVLLFVSPQVVYYSPFHLMMYTSEASLPSPPPSCHLVLLLELNS